MVFDFGSECPRFIAYLYIVIVSLCLPLVSNRVGKRFLSWAGSVVGSWWLNWDYARLKLILLRCLWCCRLEHFSREAAMCDTKCLLQCRGFMGTNTYFHILKCWGFFFFFWFLLPQLFQNVYLSIFWWSPDLASAPYATCADPLPEYRNSGP